MTSEILAVKWFSGKDTVGFVLTRSSVFEIRAFVGVAQGFDEESDARYIAEWGAEVSQEIAEAVFGKPLDKRCEPCYITVK